MLLKVVSSEQRTHSNNKNSTYHGYASDDSMCSRRSIAESYV